MLPENILSRFQVVRVETTSDTLLIHLDEKASDEYTASDRYASKGFLAPVKVRDFPIRDRAVDLVVRRRRWLDRETGSYITLAYDDFKAEGTRYSKEFAAFLKEVYGDEGYDLPFA